MEDLTYSRGDIDEALAIMREAAQWLIDSGRPMWNPEDITRDKLKNPPEEFIVAYDSDGVGAAALLLSDEDAFFWPDVPKGTSGFIHKLAVRRAFAGKGIAQRIIEHAVYLCRQQGLRGLRLDCDLYRPELCAFYERCGFTKLRTKHFGIEYGGAFDVAFYQMNI